MRKVVVLHPLLLATLQRINDAAAKTIFFLRQAEKRPVFFEGNLQKLTFYRNAINIFLFYSWNEIIPAFRRKKLSFSIVVLLFLLNGCFLRAEVVKTIPIDNFYDSTDLVPIGFPKSDFKLIQSTVKKKLDFNLQLSYDNRNRSVVLINKNKLQDLNRIGIKYEIIKNPPFRYYLPKYREILKKGYTGLSDLQQEYKSYSLNEDYLKGLAKEFPELVTYEELGKTRFGNVIPAIRITKKIDPKYTTQADTSLNITNTGESPPENATKSEEKIPTNLQGSPSIDETKVSVLFNGAHHANELIATEHCYDIIYHILSNPEEYDEILEKINIWVVPIVNPDGSKLFWYKDIRMGRKNGFLHDSHTPDEPNRGVDLNRNYPFKWNSGHPRASSSNPSHAFYRGSEPSSEPETKSMIILSKRERFLFSMSFHSFATKLLYPYTIEDVKNPKPDYPQNLAKKLVSYATSYHPVKKYEAVKNIYPVDGTDQDFYYNEFGTIAFLAESSHKNIEFSKVKYVVEGFRPVWQNLLKECLEGYKLNLKIVDPSDLPVEAEILADEFEFHEKEKNISNRETGVYRRMVPGNKEYRVRIKHPEFMEEIVKVKPSKNFEPIVVQLRIISNQN